MIDIIEFKDEHAEILAPRAIDPSVKDVNWRGWLKLNSQRGLGFTGIYEGEPVFAAGIRTVCDGVGDMWAIITPACRQCLKDMIWTQRAMIAIVASEMGYSKLRAESRIGFPESQRLLEAVGFKKVRTMLNGKYYYYMRTM